MFRTAAFVLVLGACALFGLSACECPFKGDGKAVACCPKGDAAGKTCEMACCKEAAGKGTSCGKCSAAK